MPCSVHPDREPRGVCASCGAHLCETCLVPAEGRTYCRRCRAGIVFPVGRRPVRGAAPRRSLWNRITGWLGFGKS